MTPICLQSLTLKRWQKSDRQAQQTGLNTPHLCPLAPLPQILSVQLREAEVELGRGVLPPSFSYPPGVSPNLIVPLPGLGVAEGGSWVSYSTFLFPFKCKKHALNTSWIRSPRLSAVGISLGLCPPLSQSAGGRRLMDISGPGSGEEEGRAPGIQEQGRLIQTWGVWWGQQGGIGG